MKISEYNNCVEQYADGVYRFVLKNIHDEEKAKDVVQDSFMKMWEKRKDVDSLKAKSYLFTTAYHTMIDCLRKEKKMVQNSENEMRERCTENQYSDLNEILDEALKQLPEIQRSVILLRDYEGYSYQEIGEITGLNESQVKVYIFRARVALKSYLGSLHAII